ncbi:L-2-hydroxyglutarate oxidase [Natrarchaeobius halalkaliphilus]|uniref:L-2-hydroxyglutarate oxidase n=1 Tax=Natrarchaeobius halalkaliphilus TaxID=1679091 RepID=A0A3N6LIZ9_9EURY|nr:L-2-hydroxyglutarate oxidase [Natrarchaeobius halalkaliphilus]RQG87996.1 L-2-hydroxyglutarate oxidase [Natrarchaeobius halalkaliphilus]
MSDYDVAIIGGGCIGCSTATHLAEGSDFDVCVIEKEYQLGSHQSGRNSGVLHPGFNYPPGSLKAKFSTEGTTRMKEYLTEHNLPLETTGVLVVATDETERRRLSELKRRADENGVKAEIIEGERSVREYEPYAKGNAALYCPEAASIDSQQYVYQLAADAKDGGVEFYMGHRVESVRYEGEHVITTSSGELTSRYLVNAAGLYADKIADELGVGEEYQIVPFRGEYYELVPGMEDVCESMIYPTPDPDLPFLGVHYTRRADGKVIVGPNAVLAFGRESYRNTAIDFTELRETLSYSGFWKLLGSREMARVAWNELNKSYRKERFVSAARTLVPTVRENDLTRSYAGIRAQLVDSDGTLVKDPLLSEGVRSLHVLNAVSPGLTSSLPFGERIAQRTIDSLE